MLYWSRQETVPEDTPVLICGNKVDLRTNAAGEVVYPTEGAQLAAVSADCLFCYLVQKAVWLGTSASLYWTILAI